MEYLAKNYESLYSIITELIKENNCDINDKCDSEQATLELQTYRFLLEINEKETVKINAEIGIDLSDYSELKGIVDDKILGKCIFEVNGMCADRLEPEQQVDDDDDDDFVCVSPTIKLSGGNPISIRTIDDYVELGAVSSDGVQVKINISSLKDKAGSYNVLYSSGDASCESAVGKIRTINIAEAKQIVEPDVEIKQPDIPEPDIPEPDIPEPDIPEPVIEVLQVQPNQEPEQADITPPKITLNEPNPQFINLGVGYVELGAITDDGSSIVIDHSDFRDEIGSYNIWYHSIDDSENQAVSKIRTVNVIAAPVIEQPDIPEPDVAPEINREHALANNQALGIEEVQKKKSGGGGSDWKVRPTFGLSHNTHSQLVDNGFTLNGYTVSINDNWHTEWLKTSSIIGEENHVRVISYAADGFKYVTLSLGVPEIGKVNNAETAITINLEKDYSNNIIYSVSDITHEQKENLIDESATRATVSQVYCNGGSNAKNCYAFDVFFTVMAPLSHDVLAITAVDEKRREQTTYINDGVEFTGESLLEPDVKELWHDKEWITLTKDDRRYNIWTDNTGYKWEENSFGTMIQSTFPDFERVQDDYSSVMKRTNSNFAQMINHEKEKALQVWNGTHFGY